MLTKQYQIMGRALGNSVSLLCCAAVSAAAQPFPSLFAGTDSPSEFFDTGAVIHVSGTVLALETAARSIGVGTVLVIAPAGVAQPLRIELGDDNLLGARHPDGPVARLLEPGVVASLGYWPELTGGSTGVLATPVFVCPLETVPPTGRHCDEVAGATVVGAAWSDMPALSDASPIAWPFPSLEPDFADIFSRESWEVRIEGDTCFATYATPLARSAIVTGQLERSAVFEIYRPHATIARVDLSVRIERGDEPQLRGSYAYAVEGALRMPMGGGTFIGRILPDLERMGQSFHAGSNLVYQHEWSPMIERAAARPDWQGIHMWLMVYAAMPYLWDPGFCGGSFGEIALAAVGMSAGADSGTMPLPGDAGIPPVIPEAARPDDRHGLVGQPVWGLPELLPDEAWETGPGSANALTTGEHPMPRCEARALGATRSIEIASLTGTDLRYVVTAVLADGRAFEAEGTIVAGLGSMESTMVNITLSTTTSTGFAATGIARQVQISGHAWSDEALRQILGEISQGSERLATPVVIDVSDIADLAGIDIEGRPIVLIDQTADDPLVAGNSGSLMSALTMEALVFAWQTGICRPA